MNEYPSPFTYIQQMDPGDDEVVRETESFCYLGDVVDREGGVERAKHARVAAAWTKWHKIAGLLCNRRIPLKNRSHIYEACVHSVLLYGSENWPITQRLEKCIVSCDRRMLRYVAGVSLRDRTTSEEVAERCCLAQIINVMRARRLRRYGHMQRREEGEALAVVFDMEVPGRRPRWKPRKSWLATVEEDMRELDIDSGLVNDREQ